MTYKKLMSTYNEVQVCIVHHVLACVAGVERGRGRSNLGARESVSGARGGKERNACKDAIVFPFFTLRF